MRLLLLTLVLFTLTGCIAPDGTSYTVATVDADNRLQVQTVDVDAEQEFYRGFWQFCLYATAAQYGAGDVAGCHELTATAYRNDAHLDARLLEHWRYDLVQVEEIK